MLRYIEPLNKGGESAEIFYPSAGTRVRSLSALLDYSQTLNKLPGINVEVEHTEVKGPQSMDYIQ